nr:PhzF family phenazine biosynthesis protein [Nocardioides sp.]
MRPFRQVDVFSAHALGGNPLAVVHDADGLSDVEMARFATWTNLSETTFLLPPTTAEADYRVRIFTGSGELPFAGHPTLGTAHAWLEAGGVPRGETLVQECGVGLVRVQRSGRLAFAAPALRRSGPLSDAELSLAARSLGIDVSEIVASNWVANGPEFVAVQLRDAAAVLAVEPDLAHFGDLEIGVVGLHPEPVAPGEPRVEVRVFFRGAGITEDPITGSFNAGLATWLTGSGVLPPSYVAAQGTVLGRSGRVHVDTDADGTIWVGGDTRTTILGSVDL